MPAYTINDMKILASMSVEGSPARVILEEIKYSPRKFKAYLEAQGLKKDVYYLFKMPFNQVPLLINRGELSGYVKFRFYIGK